MPYGLFENRFSNHAQAVAFLDQVKWEVPREHQFDAHRKAPTLSERVSYVREIYYAMTDVTAIKEGTKGQPQKRIIEKHVEKDEIVATAWDIVVRRFASARTIQYLLSIF